MANYTDLRLAASKLSNENYQTWKFKVEMLLTRDDLWEVISADRPEGEDQQWIKKDKQARATISLLVEDDQLIHIRQESTAKDMWTALQRVHEGSSLNSKLFLLRKLYQMRFNKGKTMQEHISALLEITIQLRSMGEEIKSNHIVAILLCSLPDTYSALINALEMRPEAEITLDFVKNRLIEEYQRRKELAECNTESDTEKALKMADTKPHTRETRVCFRCKKVGHLKKDCTIWMTEQHRPPERLHKQRVKATLTDTGAHNWNGTFKATVTQLSEKWYVDSGATSHMTNNKDFFTELDLSHKETIYLADGTNIIAEGKGNGKFLCSKGNGSYAEIPVTDVLYVPKLEGALLSVKNLVEKGLTVKFQNNKCFIQNGRETLATGRIKEHLYCLDIAAQQAKLSAQKHADCIHKWHRRLGHRHPDCIKEMQRRDLARDLTVSDCSEMMKCQCCIKAKATRMTIPKKSESRASRPLDLVHSDVCGPMKTRTVGDKRYMLTFIDDYFRFTVTYLIQSKDEVLEKLQDYVTMTRNRFKRNMLTLRSDNGGEFTGQKIERYLRGLGIEHQKTVPYTPEQNGVSERKNRSLTEMMRCMLTDSGLPDKYWGEAAATATYLQNRLLSKAVRKTPYELWHGKKPSLKHIRVFGCRAFAYIPAEKRSKLQNRAVEGVLVGYSEHSKGYRILNPKTGKVIISNSVTFIEETRDDVIIPVDSTEEESTESKETDEVEITQEVEVQHKTDTSDTRESTSEGVRRSSRENKGKAPARLSYKAKAINIQEPTSWEEIANFSEREAQKWLGAAKEEMESMEDNQTWTLTRLPVDKKAIGCKWTFKVKYDSEGKIERYKARLVAKGYSQKFGEDYDETFAPVVKHTTIRTLLLTAAIKGMQVKHFDVKTAFLHGELKEDIYMEQPPGFVSSQNPDHVCKLNKSIYGLKQAARAWNTKINGVLTEKGFVRSKADQCLYTKLAEERWFYVLIYVDDLLVCFEQEGDEIELLQELNRQFETKDLGHITHYLGMQISREDDGTFTLSQKYKIQETIEEFGLQEAKTASTPMETSYLKEPNDQSNLLQDNHLYRKAIGKLLYIATITRPDISTAVGILSRKVSKPTKMDWNAVKRVIRYLKGTINKKLKLSARTSHKLTGYVDADWAGDKSDRKSTSGYLFSIGEGLISWTSKKQSSVALSSTEAEYIAAAHASQEVVWLMQLLSDLGMPQEGPIKIYEDNQGCLALAQTERVNPRTKHIDVKHHFLRDLQEQGLIELNYCPTEDMTADILTKPLVRERHWRLTSKMGLTEETQSVEKGC